MATSLSNRNFRDLLCELLQAGGLTPSDGLITDLTVYLQELYSWNRHINLTGLKTIEEMALKHVGDTLTLMQVLPKDIHHVLDIGTGPGVPGLILKLFCPDIEIVLVDAVRKKISFLKAVIAKIGLSGIKAEHCRVDHRNPRHSPPGGFDLILSQAVGALEVLADMAGPLLSAEGLVIAMKGPDAHRELEASKDRLQGHGWTAHIIDTQTPVGKYQRSLVLMSMG